MSLLPTTEIEFITFVRSFLHNFNKFNGSREDKFAFLNDFYNSLIKTPYHWENLEKFSATLINKVLNMFDSHINFDNLDESTSYKNDYKIVCKKLMIRLNHNICFSICTTTNSRCKSSNPTSNLYGFNICGLHHRYKKQRFAIIALFLNNQSCSHDIKQEILKITMLHEFW